MKPYPLYKDSGVEWMGTVPSGWNPIKNKFNFKINKVVVGENSNDYQLLSLTKKGIIPRDIESGVGKFPEKFDTYQIVEEGDIVFCLYDIDETPRTIGLSSHSGMISGSYTVIKCMGEIHPKYIYYHYLTIDDVKGLRPYYTGLRKVVRTETFMSLKVQTPPFPEQQQISNYLDQKTKQIDDLIEKTKQKIELLKEKRTSLINHCVTKGLDSNVEMKDSGVEWIGEIPREWVTRKFKYVISNKLDNGIFKKKVDFGEGVRLVNVGDLFNEGNVISQHTLDRVRVDDSEIVKYKVNGNDIFFVRSSLKLEGIGVSSVIDELDESTVFECHVIRSIPNSSLVHPYFLKYSLNSYLTRHRIISISQTVTMTTISQDHVKGLEIVCPPLPEQNQIVIHLNQETQKIYTLMDKENQRIELLKEYRQSLISEVVTGKIDVRDEVLQ